MRMPDTVLVTILFTNTKRLPLVPKIQRNETEIAISQALEAYRLGSKKGNTGKHAKRKNVGIAGFIEDLLEKGYQLENPVYYLILENRRKATISLVLPYEFGVEATRIDKMAQDRINEFFRKTWGLCHLWINPQKADGEVLWSVICTYLKENETPPERNLHLDNRGFFFTKV